MKSTSIVAWNPQKPEEKASLISGNTTLWPQEGIVMQSTSVSKKWPPCKNGVQCPLTYHSPHAMYFCLTTY